MTGRALRIGTLCPTCGASSVVRTTKTLKSGLFHRNYICDTGHRFSVTSDLPSQVVRALPRRAPVAVPVEVQRLTEWRGSHPWALGVTA